jgi:hypothetical protein
MSRHLSILLAVALAAGSMAWTPAAAQDGFELLGSRSGEWDRDHWRGDWDNDNWRWRPRHHRRHDHFPGFSFSLGFPFPAYSYYAPRRDCFYDRYGRLYCRAY